MPKSENNTQVNYIKTREDQDYFEINTENNIDFKLISERPCPWITQDEDFKIEKLRTRIEPWLTALFQSEHLSLLLGTGITHAIADLSGADVAFNMHNATFNEFSKEIEKASKESAEKAGRAEPNIEDSIRVANELLIGLIHLNTLSKTQPDKVVNLEKDIVNILNSFASSILETEKNIIDAKNHEIGFNYLINFLMSPASRSGTRDRLNIFTTNYDRLIEAGSELAGLHLLDRFVGNLSPIFRSSRLDVDLHYNPPGIRGEPRFLEGVVRFTKLHGSIDWVNSRNIIRRFGLPFGSTEIKPFLQASNLNLENAMNLIIYPNSAKDRETAEYPYVELFRDFAASLCRPNNTLITYGYSFGDEHINRVIEDMLTIPSTHLVIISFDDPQERILQTYHKLGRNAQTTLLIGNHLGDLRILVDNYLPKPAIDRITYKMTELLNARFGIKEKESGSEKTVDSTTKQSTIRGKAEK